MGAVANLAAASGAEDASARNRRPSQQSVASQLQALREEIEASNQLLTEANRHAIALVKTQIKTNELLQALVERRGLR